MSYAAMIPFRAEGGHGEWVEFRNAWGLGARIWDVVQRHNGWSGSDWLLRGGQGAELWDLYKNPRVPADERIALATTFDRVWIPAACVPRAAAAFRAIEVAHPAGNRVSHLHAAADAMEEAVAGGAVGVAFYGTSVSECPWVRWTETDDDEGESMALDHRDPESAAISELLPDLFPRSESVPAPHPPEKQQSPQGDSHE